MNLKTHYLLSKAAANSAYNLTAWQKKLFCIGSLLPDLSLMQFFHRHFYSKSGKYVFWRLNKLSKSDSPFVMLGYGKMAHYCSDFCCSVHANGKIGSVSNHLKYEKLLDEYVQKNYSKINTAFMAENRIAALPILFEHYASCAKFNFESDIRMALNACVIVCSAACSHTTVKEIAPRKSFSGKAKGLLMHMR